MDYREMYEEEVGLRERAEAEADEMRRLVYVLWHAFSPQQPALAEALRLQEPYLREEFE